MPYDGPSAQPPRRNCQRDADLVRAVERLGIDSADVVGWAKAVADWLIAGMPVRPMEEVERIETTVCRPCEHYNEPDGRCKLCRCCVNKKAQAVRNKIRMKTEQCPIGKW